jgi:transcriptional regulator with XRE-family HTH domain
MISVLQCRMARTALGWGIRDLGGHAHIAVSTISRFESGKPTHASTLILIKQAFEAAGVRFTDTGGVEPPSKKSED